MLAILNRKQLVRAQSRRFILYNEVGVLFTVRI
jgi:hypothetical protein